ncbi:hypothetical protein LTR53_012233 [Teratosphaeriaceae sp. CCFEE 6253]|nr:hypothetical protein LTR53_012233 [Teratosphaeriaceae sp. CCFEE 6253]
MAQSPSLHPPASFLGLPAELREQIYSFCFDDSRGEGDIVIRELFLPKPCIEPPEPPISKVCALVGEESLPLYYARCALSIRTVINRTRDCFWLTGGWYRSIAPYKLARIRTLLLSFSFTRRYGSGVEATFTIRLSKHADTFQLDRVLSPNWLRGVDDPREVQLLRQHLVDGAQHLIGLPDFKGLNAAHIDFLLDLNPISRQLWP